MLLLRRFFAESGKAVGGSGDHGDLVASLYDGLLTDRNDYSELTVFVFVLEPSGLRVTETDQTAEVIGYFFQGHPPFFFR